jgi:hypothetical protein
MVPDEVPDNVYFQVDDLNRQLVYMAYAFKGEGGLRRIRFTFQAHNFDLVRSSLMVLGIHTNRWNQYLRDIFRVIRGGGWCQMVEIYYNVQSDNGSLTDSSSIWPKVSTPANQPFTGHALQQWSSRYIESVSSLKSDG